MTATNPEPVAPYRTIHPKEAYSDRANMLLLDVRTPAEFEDSHIEGSVCLPLTDLDPLHVARAAGGKRGCLLICRSGNRARQAAERLKISGLPVLSVLEGGLQAWEANGFPVQRGRRMMSLERQVRIAAGTLVLIGSILGYIGNPTWIGLSAFVGAGLVFAGITDTCGMGMLLARMPWNNRGSGADGPCTIE